MNGYVVCNCEPLQKREGICKSADLVKVLKFLLFNFSGVKVVNKAVMSSY